MTERADVVEVAERVDEADDVAAKARDVFVFFINGAKEKAPAAAGALIAKLRA